MDPPENLPDYLLTEIEEMDDEVRLAVAKFARRGGPASALVPDSIEWAFEVQDADVVEAAGEYALRLAAKGESLSSGSPSGLVDESETDTETDNVDDDPEQGGFGLFGGSW